MKSVKIMLLGMALILFGVSAALLSGLQGTPTYNNGIYQLLAVLCPAAGLALCIFGLVRKDD